MAHVENIFASAVTTLILFGLASWALAWIKGEEPSADDEDWFRDPL